MKRHLAKRAPKAKAPLLVFVQVKPKKPMAGWPMAAGGWVTLANLKALGGWSLDLDPTDIMTIEQANAAIADWKSDHRDRKAPWSYRVLHVEELGLKPPTKRKKKPTRK